MSERIPLCNSSDLADGGRAVSFDVVHGGQSCRAFAIRFEGAVHEDGEHLLVIKTTRGRMADLDRRLHELHPYQVPELVALDAEHAGAKYAEWLRSVLG